MAGLNQERITWARKAIPGGVNSSVRAFASVGGTPRFIKQASGCRVTDVDSTSYVDLVCSWGPALLGHVHPEVIAAVQNAATKDLSLGTSTGTEVELAERIHTRVPVAEHVRLVSTGTEATMTVVRIACDATGRDKIVKLAGCYHGHSDALLAAAGSGVATQGLPGSTGVTVAAAVDTIVLAYSNFDELRLLFERIGGQIATVITEATPANMGVITLAEGFDAEIRRLTAEHGVLMILDEVLTDFRVGASDWWGLEAGVETLDWTPDLITFGKVVSGGMPLVAVGDRREVVDLLVPLNPVYQAGTLSENPLTTAAEIATLDLAKPEVYDRVGACFAELQRLVGDALTGAGVPHVIQNTGNLFSVFFREKPVIDYADAQDQDTAAYGWSFHAMLDGGVALPSSVLEAWFLSVVHDDAVMETIATALKRAARAALPTGESI